ncbi:unnamed protein product [Toxocara canis]|uniref:Pepsin-I3 domain-containing protein n=1 Tax=Toxocara canis TaxID=6265 RepID=A0A183V9V9_TOXCA|nr:unnamed protein product [Toxocara canis]
MRCDAKRTFLFFFFQGNKLFANGFFLRELTAAEQRELADYEKNVKQYKEDMQQALEEKRKDWQNRHGKSTKSSSAVAKKELPKAPEKPSFCSAADTTQYYFDGCMVQNNKVYVGREYARDLTPEEIAELKEFDAKMTEYQKFLTSSIQQQVQGLFGSSSDFWSLLGDPSPSTSPAPVPSTTLSPVEAPPAPSFCTAIY